MSHSRRSLLAAGTAGLASCASTSAPGPGDAGISRTVAALVQRSEASNAALVRGDIEGYRAMAPHADDYTLMSPFGGTPTHGADMTEESWAAVGRFFRNGTFEQQVVQTYGSADMVVLATRERCHAEVGGLPAQDWLLRVTLVYRREGGQWLLAHSHADPLVTQISLARAAALAAGDAPAMPRG